MKIDDNSTTVHMKAHAMYMKIRTPIKCMCLNQFVHFNAKGFHHLIYDGTGRTRTIKEQNYKFSLIPLIVPVIMNSSEAVYRKSKEKENRKKDSKIKDIEYWGLTALVGKNKDKKVKVILRRVGNGRIIFWSVMKMNTSKNTKK